MFSGSPVPPDPRREDVDAIVTQLVQAGVKFPLRQLNENEVVDAGGRKILFFRRRDKRGFIRPTFRVL